MLDGNQGVPALSVPVNTANKYYCKEHPDLAPFCARPMAPAELPAHPLRGQDSRRDRF